MAFDPAIFEAEVALQLILTEQLPSIALDALEAGYDGPHVVRMAVLEPSHVWVIDQALPLMLEEFGLASIAAEEAAIRLAHLRARRILETGEDPLPSLPYFNRLMRMADYPDALMEVGYIEDEFDFLTEDNAEERRVRAREALESLLSPELGERRKAERRVAWERELVRARREWPYVLNSTSGRALLKSRYLEKVKELRPFFWIELVAWAFFGWGTGLWRIVFFGYVVTVPILFALRVWGEYRRMKRERRDMLLRRGVAEELI